MGANRTRRNAGGSQKAIARISGFTAAVASISMFLSPTAKASRWCFANVSAEQCAILCSARLSSDTQPAARLTDDTQETGAAQHDAMNGMKGMEMHFTPPAELLMREASGTSMNPASAVMPMRMMMKGEWNLGFMANAFITDTQQSGPRGTDKLYSTSIFMGSAERSIGRGALLFDLMLSLEPATITEREYPLLFQTGETAFGRPIVDGQHPHNFVMAAGVHYARPVGDNAIFEAYFAPIGDPSLGPIAYPHRSSAAELPQAPIGHHWEDSTHISYEVATIALKYKALRWEASGFHGAEPNENRWNIATGAMDSWSTRVSIFPTANWVAQVSVGRLTHPEALEPGDVVRTTASVEYSRPMGDSVWSTSFVFGRNHHTATGRGTSAILAESVIPCRVNNFFTGRWELADKDELFVNQPAIEQQLMATAGTTTFRIGEYTLGYTRYFPLWAPLNTGIGANFSTYTLPAAIVPYYGDHPFGVNFYLHFTLKPPK